MAAGMTGADAPRDWKQSVLRGARGRCPHCGEGKMFRAYLKVAHACDNCGEELHHQRADDAPPYFVMTVVGKVVIIALVAIEQTYDNVPLLFHAILWPLVIMGMSLWLLPVFKGGLIGHQWALKMHGFGGETDDPVLSAKDEAQWQTTKA